MNLGDMCRLTAKGEEEEAHRCREWAERTMMPSGDAVVICAKMGGVDAMKSYIRQSVGVFLNDDQAGAGEC